MLIEIQTHNIFDVHEREIEGDKDDKNCIGECQLWWIHLRKRIGEQCLVSGHCNYNSFKITCPTLQNPVEI